MPQPPAIPPDETEPAPAELHRTSDVTAVGAVSPKCCLAGSSTTKLALNKWPERVTADLAHRGRGPADPTPGTPVGHVNSALCPVLGAEWEQRFAASYGQTLSDATIVAVSIALTCSNFLEQRTCWPARSVRIEGVRGFKSPQLHWFLQVRGLYGVLTYLVLLTNGSQSRVFRLHVRPVGRSTATAPARKNHLRNQARPGPEASAAPAAPGKAWLRGPGPGTPRFTPRSPAG
jgi:hypothetical protein